MSIPKEVISMINDLLQLYGTSLDAPMGTKPEKAKNIGKYMSPNSIIPEFTEKIDLLRLSNEFITKENNITNRYSDSVIKFRGIKTSQGLKIFKAKVIILDQTADFLLCFGNGGVTHGFFTFFHFILKFFQIR